MKSNKTNKQSKQYPITKYRIITGDGYYISSPENLKDDLKRSIQQAEDIDKLDASEEYRRRVKNRIIPKHVIKITEELIPLNEIL